ncbi:hypothetical protein KG365_004968 [Salmonella enterica]|nr:hypothetical protein [Salmonella enterica]EIL6383736.1 hypothetical protein [Salmonella enterica]EJI9078033.1 hypothetical protein [Salmonella enterica]
MNDEMFYFLVDNITDEDKPCNYQSYQYAILKKALDTNSDKLILQAGAFIWRYMSGRSITYRSLKSLWKAYIAVHIDKAQPDIYRIKDHDRLLCLPHRQLVTALTDFYVHCAGKRKQDAKQLALCSGLHIITGFDKNIKNTLYFSGEKILLNVRNRMITECYSKGIRQAALIEKFNLSQTQIYAILRGAGKQ